MKIQKTRIIIWTCITAVLLLLFLNVSFSSNPFDGGGCFSVAFDKLPMMLADKVVICLGEETTYEVTDIELVREISSATQCATNTDLCYSGYNRWIDIYCGNVLIRRMSWDLEHNGILVYNADIFHWIFPSKDGHGLVYPSAELIAKLEAVIESD